MRKLLVSIIAISWSIFQLYYAATGVFDLLQLLPLHLMFAMVLVFLLHPLHKTPTSIFFWIDILLIALCLLGGVYYLANYPRIITRIRFISPVTSLDLFFGVITIVLLMEAARRTIGIALPILGISFLIYAFFGSHFPGILSHREISFEELIESLYLTQEGIFSVPLRVSGVIVFLFILLGAFLKFGGIGSFYNDFALAIAGGSRGGAAKVAVVSSSMMGTISGSATANVATTGTFTIPMMIKVGYKRVFAGAVEALASTGGQIMPPLMGAAAFIIAQLTGTPYWYVVLAAILPAILYYAAVYIQVHLEALKLGLGVIPTTNRPNLKKLIFTQGYMVTPLIILIYFLAIGSTVNMAAMMAILICAIIMSLSFLIQKNWDDFKKFLKALEWGARAAIIVAIPCALAGIIIGVLTLTGLSLKLTNNIVAISGGNVFFLLSLIAVICIILGMGMPTSAAYITVAIVAVPALIMMGIPVLAAHLFAFYFAEMSMITPPIALAAYTAAGIAGCNNTSIGLQACRMGLPIFIIPFLFVFYPSLLLVGSPLYIVIIFFKALFIISALSIALNGYLFKRTNILKRISLTVAAVFVITPVVLLNITGFALFAGTILHSYRAAHKLEIGS